jgi:polyisoprenoid-binding protein YceI
MRIRFAVSAVLASLALMLASWMVFAALHQVGAPSVSTHALGPAGLKIDMQSNDLSVSEKDEKIILTSDLNKLSDKDSELRTKHMHEDFQTSQYPTVTLVVARSDLKLPPEGQKITAEAPGLLTLHGVTKPVRFQYTASRGSGAYDVSGTTTIDYTEFLGKKINRFGVTVDPKVTIDVKLKVADS